jgi:hypothetical protein
MKSDENCLAVWGGSRCGLVLVVLRRVEAELLRRCILKDTLGFDALVFRGWRVPVFEMLCPPKSLMAPQGPDGISENRDIIWNIFVVTLARRRKKRRVSCKAYLSNRTGF